MFTALAALALVGVQACHRPRPPPPRPQAQAQNDVATKDAAAAPSVVPSAVPQEERWLTEAQLREVDLRTAPVRAGAIPAPITISGRIAFDDLHVAHVVPPVNGYVTRVLAQPGQHVARGDALACISSPELGQVVADVETSHADLLAAERDLARSQALFVDHAVAKKEVEGAERRFAGAQAEYRRVREKHALLGGGKGEGSDVYVVRAPIDGNVILRNVTVGSNVQGQYENGPSAPELFTLGSLDTVWAIAELFEMDVAHVHVGDPVEVSVVAYPNERFVATVDWVASNVDPETRTTRLRCQLPNARRLLRPEMFVTMKVGGRGQNGVVVPVSSIFYLGGRHYVFVAATTPSVDGRRRFARRLVTVHPDAGAEEVAVTSGLQDGEQVVVRGGILLTSGF